MSKTALNVIAISIFTLTLTSLLGPLFNLSPAVPAIAVAGILGLGTLDTLSWQGQGATLFLDWLASFSAEHRARIIRHEAGHFLGIGQPVDSPDGQYLQVQVVFEPVQ